MVKAREVILSVIYTFIELMVTIILMVYVLPRILSRFLRIPGEVFVSPVYFALVFLTAYVVVAIRFVIKPLKVALRTFSSLVQALLTMYILNFGVIEQKVSIGTNVYEVTIDLKPLLYAIISAILLMNLAVISSDLGKD